MSLQTLNIVQNLLHVTRCCLLVVQGYVVINVPALRTALIRHSQFCPVLWILRFVQNGVESSHCFHPVKPQERQNSAAQISTLLFFFPLFFPASLSSLCLRTLCTAISPLAPHRNYTLDATPIEETKVAPPADATHVAAAAPPNE